MGHAAVGVAAGTVRRWDVLDWLRATDVLVECRLC